jgi:hypothetical protein
MNEQSAWSAADLFATGFFLTNSYQESTEKTRFFA